MTITNPTQTMFADTTDPVQLWLAVTSALNLFLQSTNPDTDERATATLALLALHDLAQQQGVHFAFGEMA